GAARAAVRFADIGASDERAAMSCPPTSSESQRVRDIFQRDAPKYDRQISFFEKVLFGGGREWVCSRAEGEVLEIAAGTGRNLSFYPPPARLTMTELTPAMLALARHPPADPAREAAPPAAR